VKWDEAKWDEAVPWIRKAMTAPRYEARRYSHFNPGRVYEHQGDWGKAKECYGAAYSLNVRIMLRHWRGGEGCGRRCMKTGPPGCGPVPIEPTLPRELGRIRSVHICGRRAPRGFAQLFGEARSGKNRTAV
jgi:hypothetical protein